MKKKVVSIDQNRERATEALQRANGWCVVAIEDKDDGQEITWFLDSDDRVGKLAVLGGVFACLMKSANSA